jgi:hypothetical protein
VYLDDAADEIDDQYSRRASHHRSRPEVLGLQGRAADGRNEEGWL